MTHKVPKCNAWGLARKCEVLSLLIATLKMNEVNSNGIGTSQWSSGSRPLISRVNRKVNEKKVEPGR